MTNSFLFPSNFTICNLCGALFYNAHYDGLGHKGGYCIASNINPHKYFFVCGDLHSNQPTLLLDHLTTNSHYAESFCSHNNNK